MKKFFTTSCILLCLLGQAQVCDGAENGVPPKPSEKSVPKKPLLDQFLGLVAGCKKLFKEKTSRSFSSIKENFAPTEEDTKKIESIKKGCQQNIAPLVHDVKQIVVDPMLNFCFKAPVEIIANGLPQDPKKVEEKKYKNIVYSLQKKIAQEENKKKFEKLKPYCPDGKPGSLAEQIDKEAAHQEQMALCRAKKDQLAKELEELQTTIRRSHVSYRSDSKTALVILGSVACGLSIGALTYYLLNFLSSSKDCAEDCAEKTKRCEEELKELSTECQKLKIPIKRARRALKKGIPDAAKRAEVENFLKNNVQSRQEKRKKIASKKRTLYLLKTKNFVQTVGIPFVSLAAAIATAAASLNLCSQIWPASTLPEISTPPEKMAELEKSLATTNEKYGEVSKNFNELEQIGKAMLAIPQEAKIRLIEWQQSEMAVKNTASLVNKDRNEHDKRTGEAAGLVTNAYTNQLNSVI